MSSLLRALPALLLLLATASGCPSQEIYPLYGEGPEIAELLEQPLPEDPQTSALAAARRLHQALVQSDTELAWALLAEPTRRAMDERGALIGTSGRELLDAGSLPTTRGTVLKVRYDAVFFGPEVAGLTEAPEKDQKAGARVLVAKSQDGQLTPLKFVKEEDGWKLLKTDF